MKKLTFIFAIVCMLFAQPLSAQIKVLSNGNVKMGSLSSSTSTTYGMEVGFQKILILFNTAALDVKNGATLEITSGSIN